MSSMDIQQDERFMRRCIELANEAGKAGDLPFGSIVVLDGEILGEGSNLLQQTK
jgi:tRNA(adenine34) deaminase